MKHTSNLVFSFDKIQICLDKNNDNQNCHEIIILTITDIMVGIELEDVDDDSDIQGFELLMNQHKIFDPTIPSCMGADSAPNKNIFSKIYSSFTFSSEASLAFSTFTKI
jgi:hypothetical protein